MQLLSNYRYLKASSLVESIIAIVIISVCAMVAFLIYLNVVSQTNSINYYKAKQHIELLTNDIITQKDYENDVVEFKGYNIEKDITINKKDFTATVAFTITTNNKDYTINKLIPYYEQ